MRLGIARYTRPCPLCQELIRTGDRITCQGIAGSYAWVHESCFMPWQVARVTRRLDEEFRAVVGGR